MSEDSDWLFEQPEDAPKVPGILAAINEIAEQDPAEEVLVPFEQYVERNFQPMLVVVIKDALTQYRQKLKLDKRLETLVTKKEE